MKIYLPEALKSFVNEQIALRCCGTTEYVCELISKDMDVQRLRRLLLDGAESSTGMAADVGYFDALRERVAAHLSGARSPRNGPPFVAK